MSACDIVAELSLVPAITAALTQPAAITAAVTAPAAISANVTAPASISAALVARATISSALTAAPTISAALATAPTIVASLGDDMSLYLSGLERASERARRDVKKLAAYTTTIAVHTSAPSPVELPTGLIVYPSYRDSGFIDIRLGGAHANMNGATVTLALYLGPFGSPVNVANFTSPPINPTSAVGNFQLEFQLVLKSQGVNSQNYSGLWVWNDGSGVNTSPIIGRLVTSGAYTGFGDPANGDSGDVELRLDASISTSGPTFNLRNYTIEQHSPRGLSQ